MKMAQIEHCRNTWARSEGYRVAMPMQLLGSLAEVTEYQCNEIE